jgi:antitoxin component YwqK of YwqJK toxin-antitoxin module
MSEKVKKKKSLMGEKLFQSEIFRWRDSNSVSHMQRLPDLPWMQKRNSAVTSGIFQFKKPYDMYWLENGRFHAIELKYVKGFTWNFSKLEDQQYDHLIEVHAQGGHGWAIINFRNGDLSSRARKKYNTDKMNRTFALNINQILDLQALDGAEKVELDWLVDNAIEIPRTFLGLTDKNGKLKPDRDQIGWDLRVISNGFDETGTLISEKRYKEADVLLKKLETYYGIGNIELVGLRAGLMFESCPLEE